MAAEEMQSQDDLERLPLVDEWRVTDEREYDLFVRQAPPRRFGVRDQLKIDLSRPLSLVFWPLFLGMLGLGIGHLVVKGPNLIAAAVVIVAACALSVLVRNFAGLVEARRHGEVLRTKVERLQKHKQLGTYVAHVSRLEGKLLPAPLQIGVLLPKGVERLPPASELELLVVIAPGMTLVIGVRRLETRKKKR